MASRTGPSVIGREVKGSFMSEVVSSDWTIADIGDLTGTLVET